MKEANETTMGDFYLPAMTLRTDFGRIEALVGDLLDTHGVVPIPDSYNE